jgi:hypothetical protein
MQTNGNKPWDKLNMKCPSCHQEKETTAHTLFCNKNCRVDAFMKSIDLLEQWLNEVGTDPPLLRDCIVEYTKSRGGITIEEIRHALDQRY